MENLAKDVSEQLNKLLIEKNICEEEYSKITEEYGKLQSFIDVKFLNNIFLF